MGPEGSGREPDTAPGQAAGTLRVLAVAVQKGGTGKTTLAASLAIAAAEAGEQVTALDLDPQGSLAGWGALRRTTPSRSTGSSPGRSASWRRSWGSSPSRAPRSPSSTPPAARPGSRPPSRMPISC